MKSARSHRAERGVEGEGVRMPVNNNLVPSLIATRNSSNQPPPPPKIPSSSPFCSLVQTRGGVSLGKLEGKKNKVKDRAD